MEQNVIKPKKRKARKSPKSDFLDKAKNLKKHRKSGQLEMSDDEFDEDRGRTPSGSNLAGTVKDLRYFFSPKQQTGSYSQSSNSTVTSSVKENLSSGAKSAKSAKQNPDNNNNKNQPSCLGVNHDDSVSDANDSYHSIGLQRINQSESEIEEETRFIHQLAEVLQHKTMSGNESIEDMDASAAIKAPAEDTSADEQSNLSINNMVSSVERNDDADPAVMGISSVIELMKKLKKDISQEVTEGNKALKSDLKAQIDRIELKCVQQVQQNIEQKLPSKKEVEKIDSELEFWKMKSEALMEVCNRMHTEIGDLTTRIENLEMTNSKKMLLISGLTLVQDSKKRETLLFLNDFINSTLGLHIVIDDYYTLGAWNPKPIVLILQSVEDKRLILQNKSVLKNIPTSGGKPIFISEYFPPTANEKRKRDQEIRDQMADKGLAETVTYVRGNIAVKGEVYLKPITPPTPRELIDQTFEELEKTLQFKTTRGEVFQHKNSAFLGYSARVRNLEEIKTVYRKIKLLKPDARHVVCAYFLNDNTLLPHEMMDYQDDGEPGAGRAILNILETKQCAGTAVFVARNYGGIRMGADRFLLYAQAAKSALGINPNEHIEKKTRNVTRRKHNMQQNQQQQSYNQQPKVSTGMSQHRPHQMHPVRQARPATQYYPSLPRLGNPSQLRPIRPPLTNSMVSQSHGSYNSSRYPPAMQRNYEKNFPQAHSQYRPRYSATPLTSSTNDLRQEFQHDFPTPTNPPVLPETSMSQHSVQNEVENHNENDQMQFEFSEPQDASNHEQWSDQNPGVWEKQD